MKDSDFIQQETQVRDTVGNRWIKCRFCGEIGRDDMFISYGGAGTLNMGTCRECAANNPDYICWLREMMKCKERKRHRRRWILLNLCSGRDIAERSLRRRLAYPLVL